MQHKEDYFIGPMLKVLYFANEQVSTDYIKQEIKKFCLISDEDLKPYPSRNKNEPRYYQIVGNIISHGNSHFFKYVSKVLPIGEETKKYPRYMFKLNSLGREYVKSDLIKKDAVLDYIENDEECNEMTEDYILLSSENKNEIQLNLSDKSSKIIDNVSKNGFKKRLNTDSNVAKSVLELNEHRCKVGLYLNENHHTFNTKEGSEYVEAHHLIPMKASKDFYPLSLDIPVNIISLCPMCHAKLHRGSIEEKKKILRFLYDNTIESLNENGIYISFESLLNKYYI